MIHSHQRENQPCIGLAALYRDTHVLVVSLPCIGLEPSQLSICCEHRASNVAGLRWLMLDRSLLFDHPRINA